MNPLVISFLMLITTAIPAHAGILAESTRVIYPADVREQSLMLVNTNDYPVIVQSWADNGNGDPQSASVPFIVLPAIFRLAPQAIQGLRIIYNHESLPSDRESVFWLNLYEIPPTNDERRDSRRLMLAMNTQLKIFYRPKAVTIPLSEAVRQLKFRARTDGFRRYIECDNPTPLHISFTSIVLRQGVKEQTVESQPDMMTPPFSRKEYMLHGLTRVTADGRIRFHYLDDAGTQHTFDTILSDSE